MNATIVSRLQSLADATRNRLLLLLERHELTVTDLCAVLQLPQSTASRHLKVLADDGWVSSRADGASRLYRMTARDLDAPAKQLWQVVRQEVAETPGAARDAERLRRMLNDRRAESAVFFAAAAQWDGLRAELFGTRTELLPLLGMIDPAWTVADLGCGTGHLTVALAPFARNVVAVDASAPMIRAAQARALGLPNVLIKRGELEELPLDTASVDLACMVLVLPYVAELAAVFAEAARVLKPGGTLLVTDLMPHEREDYRHTMGHRRLGVSEEALLDVMKSAGLTGRYVPAPMAPDAKGPRLFTSRGVKL